MFHGLCPGLHRSLDRVIIFDCVGQGGDPCKSARLWNNDRGKHYTRDELVRFLKSEIRKRDNYVARCRTKYFD